MFSLNKKTILTQRVKNVVNFYDFHWRGTAALPCYDVCEHQVIQILPVSRGFQLLESTMQFIHEYICVYSNVDAPVQFVSY
jgi:hypothetical protein